MWLENHYFIFHTLWKNNLRYSVPEKIFCLQLGFNPVRLTLVLFILPHLIVTYFITVEESKKLLASFAQNSYIFELELPFTFVYPIIKSNSSCSLFVKFVLTRLTLLLFILSSVDCHILKIIWRSWKNITNFISSFSHTFELKFTFLSMPYRWKLWIL